MGRASELAVQLAPETTFVVRDQAVIDQIADAAASDLNICLTELAELEASWFAQRRYKRDLEYVELTQLGEVLERAAVATRGLLATRDLDEVRQLARLS